MSSSSTPGAGAGAPTPLDPNLSTPPTVSTMPRRSASQQQPLPRAKTNFFASFFAKTPIAPPLCSKKGY